MSASEQDHLQRLASEFGKRVREHREERDLTQEAAAIMTGISITTYQKIEQGVRMPRLENVVKVIHGLKIDPGYLFAGLGKLLPATSQVAVPGRQRRSRQ
ncbi:XRE family transcriptional regulator [Mycobacteroides abscessus]|uniref:helix-turn-helix domain-containing protein n=1 Tax=Mycobacteroides abscessus TaxID=36809 RepID=UPI000C25AA0D|nr:helix-turn-helix transcriptional regulator [Mycobacteroides abscessus]MDO3109818.1 helix-turn-helix transcriptional regulator [Mycobacteroides abscessus subsp. abscessus]PVA22805.1 XRE family transcriptional regulator [Mycobacteroides abscessus]PVA83876.1 XRE family transcriptional regulator [Mycobacteroides abscessus]RIR96138.1 XRE family transcriptional regulator [Mycobacteroides abscessus]RIS07964.1 XRE family transcriptional regulator [Mycobacteroides abscessus]